MKNILNLKHFLIFLLAIMQFLQQLQAQQSIAVNISPLTDTNCVAQWSHVTQRVWVKNTCGETVSEIAIIIDVFDINRTYSSIYHNIIQTILPNDSEYVDIQYYVPIDSFYYVNAKAYMISDSALVNDTDSIQECTGLDDLRLEPMEMEQIWDYEVDLSKNFQVKIWNTSPHITYTDVIIWAVITDKHGKTLQNTSDTIPKIDSLSNVSHIFTYTVPDELSFYIRTFLESKDNYPQNDTVLISCYIIISPSIKNIATIQNNIYYNSINQEIVIDEVLQNQSLTLVLYDMLGKMIISKTDVGNTVSIANLPNGVYVYRLLENKQVISKGKVVK